MDLRELTEKDKGKYNKLTTHILQSWEWGEARLSMGTAIKRYGIFTKGKLRKAFQISFHKIPLIKYNVGYLPKGPLPDKTLYLALQQIGRKENCAFIKIEPNIRVNEPYHIYPSFRPSPKPLFTKYNFIINLAKPEDDLLKSFHSKTRYNIKVAEKHKVTVEERLDDEAFNTYLKLYFDTTKRQGYFGHNQDYHRIIWQSLRKHDMARLLIAYYGKTPLTAWMLLNYKDTLYYPYGGSSDKHREVMASNLIAWEAIKLGKKLKLTWFDLWGALGPNASEDNSWYGFHRFKKGYGGSLVEYLGTFDVVQKPLIYYLFNLIDRSTKLKVTLLKLLRR